MLGIILCDDDKFILNISVEKINALIAGHSYDCAIMCSTSDYGELIRFTDKNRSAFLCFIDLDFGDGKLNGIDIAKLLKQANALSKIVFVTNHAEMAMQVLKSGVEPFGFIEKTSNVQLLVAGYKKYIELALSNLNAAGAATDDGGRPRSIRLKVGVDETADIPVSRILYVEACKTSAHNLKYRTIDGSEVTVRGTIDNTLDALGGGFLRSHRSIIVNMRYVVDVSNGLVIFSNGETAACSIRLKNQIKRGIRS